MQVEIWSDVVCPWCAIGRARFQQALAQFAQADRVDVRWRSFELDRSRRDLGEVDYVEMLARKYRTTTEQAQAMIDRMTRAGAEEGVEFRFDIARPGNTFDAHRLLHLAADRGIQDHVKGRFLAGYHGEGVAIADHDALTELAGDAGLDRDEVRDVLGSDRYADAVRADEEQAYEYGISGVPFFVVDRQVGVAGAQPADQLLAVLEDVAAERTPQHDHPDGHGHAPGERCDDASCAV